MLILCFPRLPPTWEVSYSATALRHQGGRLGAKANSRRRYRCSFFLSDFKGSIQGRPSSWLMSRATDTLSSLNLSSDLLAHVDSVQFKVTAFGHWGSL